MPRSFQIVCLLVFLRSSFLRSAPIRKPRRSPSRSHLHPRFPCFPAGALLDSRSIRWPARYQSSGRLSADSDDTDSFDLDFTVTAETRQKIFELAAKAGYFQKDVDSHHKGLAFTGKKTLTYKDAQPQR